MSYSAITVKKRFLTGLYFLGVAALTSCTSTPRTPGSTVIANIDDTLKTPAWANGSVAMYQEAANVVYVHAMTLNEGDSRPDACLSMAKTHAVGEMLKYIKQSITSSGQVEDLNAASDPSLSSLTAYLSQGHLSGTSTFGQYWEVRSEYDPIARVPFRKLRCAVKVGIDKKVLDRQMRQAIEGAPGGNLAIREKLLEKQKEFLDHVSQESPVPEAN